MLRVSRNRLGTVTTLFTLPRAFQGRLVDPLFRAARLGLSRFALLTTLLLTGCGSHGGLQPLRIGISPWPGYELLYLAKAQGMFASRGLAVQVVELSSLGDVRRAFEAGQIDAMVGTPVEVLQAERNAGSRLEIVQALDFSNGGDVILARASIDRVAQLAGKTIGVEAASLGPFILKLALEQAGLPYPVAKLENIAPKEMLGALKTGRVDAVVTYAPFSAEILRETSARTLFTSKETPGRIIDVLALRADWATARPNDMTRLRQAYADAWAYLQDHRADALAIMAQRESLTPDELALAFDQEIQLIRPADQERLLAVNGPVARAFRDVTRVLREIGELPPLPTNRVAPEIIGQGATP